MCTFRDLEGGASKTSVPFDIHRQRSERQTEPSEKSCLFSPEFPLGQLERNITGNRERVVLKPFSKIQWVRSGGHSR